MGTRLFNLARELFAQALARVEGDPLSGLPIRGVAGDVGGRIGTLTIDRILGAGGTSVVYAARDVRLDRPVAVKVLRNALPTAEALGRFESESRVLARLQHPGVARVYSTGVHKSPVGSAPYIVMELVEGARTLTEFIRERNPTTPERLAMFADICDRISVLQRGSVLAEGPYAEVSKNPGVIEAYMGPVH